MKKQIMDILQDLHARHLDIPAGMIAFLIVVAVVVLPKHAAEPAAPIATPHAAQEEVQADTVAQVSLVDSNGSIDTASLTYDPKNPFGVKPAPTAATGATGGTGGGSTGSTGGPTGGGGGSTPGGSSRTTALYVVDVTFDNAAIKAVQSGEGLPDDATSILIYAGTASSGKKARFLVADGVTVQGAELDTDLGMITIAAGDQVILTEGDGTIHNFTLDKIKQES